MVSVCKWGTNGDVAAVLQAKLFSLRSLNFFYDLNLYLGSRSGQSFNILSLAIYLFVYLQTHKL